VGKRVLITGLASFWGGLVARALEQDPNVDVLIGLDTREPSVELERTEYVRTDENYSILSRIVQAARIDTIAHTFLIIDSTSTRAARMHEVNVIGTMNLFAAASAPGSTVRDVMVKSSAYVYGASREDPTWFREDTPRTHPAANRMERSLEAVEGYVRDFAEDNPHVNVTLLRFSNVLGPDIVTPISKALELPLVPSLLGYDPRFQFVHEDDVIRSILFVLDQRLPGIYNVAGDGLLPWTEVAKICGKRTFPIIPYGQGLVTQPLKLLSGVDLPAEVLALLRYGRGIDNRRLKQAGFQYQYTSAGAVKAFVEALRLRTTVGAVEPTYTYERDVEQFFRHSPAVVRDPDGSPAAG
jgi:UDP-glucose 4-epimerase